MRWRRRKFSKAIRGAVDFEPLLVAAGPGSPCYKKTDFPAALQAP